MLGLKYVKEPHVLSGLLILNTKGDLCLFLSFERDSYRLTHAGPDYALQYIQTIFMQTTKRWLIIIQPAADLNVSSLGLSRRVLTWTLPSIAYTLACTYLPLPPPLSIAIRQFPLLPACAEILCCSCLHLPRSLLHMQIIQNKGIIPLFPKPYRPINRHHHSASLSSPPLSASYSHTYTYCQTAS